MSFWKIMYVTLVGVLAITGGSYGAMAEQLKMVSGSVGGGYFKAAAAFSEYVAAEIPGIKITVGPGTTWANVDQLDSGKVDLAVIENVVSSLAWSGDSPTGVKYDFRMLAAVRGPSVVQAFVPVDRGIESFEQILKEKRSIRIATFERSQLVTAIAIDVLAGYGITPEKLESWGGQLIFTSLKQGFEMLGDGVADMWLTGGSFYPHPAAAALGLKGKYRLLPISSEVAGTVAAKYGMQLAEVPAGAYADSNGENEAYPSPMVVVTFAVNKDLDDDLVYNMMDALWKHREEFYAVHKQHKVFTIDFAKANVGSAPIHPGAERWYADQK